MLASEKIFPEDAGLLRLSDDPLEICKIVIDTYQEDYHQERGSQTEHREQSIR